MDMDANQEAGIHAWLCTLCFDSLSRRTLVAVVCFPCHLSWTLLLSCLYVMLGYRSESLNCRPALIVTFAVHASLNCQVCSKATACHHAQDRGRDAEKHQAHMAVGMEKKATGVLLLGFRLIVLLPLQSLHCYQSAWLQSAAVMFATLCSSSSNRPTAVTSLLWQHCSFPA